MRNIDKKNWEKEGLSFEIEKIIQIKLEKGYTLQ